MISIGGLGVCLKAVNGSQIHLASSFSYWPPIYVLSLLQPQGSVFYNTSILGVFCLDCSFALHDAGAVHSCTLGWPEGTPSATNVAAEAHASGRLYSATSSGLVATFRYSSVGILTDAWCWPLSGSDGGVCWHAQFPFWTYAA